MMTAMNPLLLILHLEDSPRDAELVRDNLRKASVDCELRVACDRAEYEAALVQARFDLILSDYKLPNYDGLAALALAREKQPEVPFILISGTLGEEAAVDCLKRGATDYVLKHRLERLVPAVRRALQEAQERRARIQAEEASRVSEEQFRAMFEVASIGMAQADPRTGQWLRVNQKMCEITGYPAAELLGKRVSELTHPDDRQKDSEAFQRVVRGDAPDYRMEKRYLRKDGAVVWVNVNMTVIRDAASQPTRTMATIEEITERKQAEQRVRELNRVLRATGAVNALMARERDPKRLLAEASQILVDTRGYRFVWIGLVEAGSKRVVPQARAGKDTGYFDTVTITWDETPAGQGPIGTAIRTGQLVACQDIATDPRSASYRQDAVARGIASMAALPMIYGSRVLGAVAVYSERTGSFDAEELDLLNELAGDLAFALQSIEHEQERKHLEEALRESSQLNQQIIASAQEGIIVYGRDLKYQAWNPFMEQHSGLPAREVLGKHPLELFPFLRDAGVLASIEKALAGEPTPTTDFPYENTRSGKSGWALAMHGPLRNAAGEIIGVIGIVRDITERKQADEKLARSHEHYRRAITAASAIPYQKDYASDTYVFIGEEIRDVTGYAPSELRSAVWKEMVLGTVFLGETAELSAAEAARRAVAGEIKNWRADHRIRTRSGEIRWISDSSISVLDASGKYAGSMGIIQDITERKRAEIRVEAFSKLGLRLSAAKTAREAAGIICETASELLGWDACLFGLYSPSKALLDLVLQVDTIDGRRVEFSPGYQPPSVTARRAMETGGQLILKEKPGEMLPGGQPFGDSSRPSASIMYVPIRKGAEVVGALSIQSYTPQAYDQRSLETLQSLADHCGGALDRVRMTQAWQTTQEPTISAGAPEASPTSRCSSRTQRYSPFLCRTRKSRAICLFAKSWTRPSVTPWRSCG